VFLNLVIQNFTYLLEDSDVAQTLIHLFARHAPPSPYVFSPLPFPLDCL
jgi:hypothetical protein